MDPQQSEGMSRPMPDIFFCSFFPPTPSCYWGTNCKCPSLLKCILIPPLPPPPPLFPLWFSISKMQISNTTAQLHRADQPPSAWSAISISKSKVIITLNTHIISFLHIINNKILWWQCWLNILFIFTRMQSGYSKHISSFKIRFKCKIKKGVDHILASPADWWWSISLPLCPHPAGVWGHHQTAL